MTTLFDIKTTPYSNEQDIRNNNLDYAMASFYVSRGDGATLYGCFTGNVLKDIIFIKSEPNSKNYIAVCSRSYVYGVIDHWSIDKLIEVSREEGNKIYTQIKDSKFIAKSGKEFYRANML